jgi:tetratricopeptide (TPR) repeat protein
MRVPARAATLMPCVSRSGQWGLVPLSAACVLAGLLAALPAEATTGGSSSAGGFCLERGGKRILYVYSQGGESGCEDLKAIELATGRDSVLLGCYQGQLERTKLLEGCQPLVPARLEELGLGAEIHQAGSPTYEVIRGGQPVLADDFSTRCPQALTLQRGTQRLSQWNFAPCCNSMYSEETPPVAAMTAYALPGKPFLLLLLRHPGRCYESGYIQDESLLVPDAFGAQGAPRLQGKDPRLTKTWALLDLPALDLPRLYNEAGFSLYQKGHLAEAVGYFHRAYEQSLWGPRHLLALYNEAATLSRLGRTDEVLARLRLLLSYAAERERFRKKLAQDKDFASMRADPRLTALLKEKDCCREETVTPLEGGRREQLIHWVEGEEKGLRNTEWKGGVKILEWDAAQGMARSWHENGKLKSEVAITPEGLEKGVLRTWRPDGTLESEAEYEQGVRHGLERDYDRQGRLDEVKRWREGELLGPEPLPPTAPADAGSPPVPAP